MRQSRSFSPLSRRSGESPAADDPRQPVCRVKEPTSWSRSPSGDTRKMTPESFHVREDDLTDPQTRALLRLHLEDMHANSPPGSVFALDDAGLTAPGVTLWSVWQDHRIAGMGALKDLRDGTGELKSMRTHPDFLRRGVASLLLEHIIEVARKRGMTRLSLETGSGAAFDPALRLYRRRGFLDGEAFADYRRSDFNQFLHLAL